MVTSTAIKPTVTVINAVRPGAARSSRVAWYMTLMVAAVARQRIARGMGLPGQLSVDPDCAAAPPGPAFAHSRPLRWGRERPPRASRLRRTAGPRCRRRHCGDRPRCPRPDLAVVARVPGSAHRGAARVRRAARRRHRRRGAPVAGDVAVAGGLRHRVRHWPHAARRWPALVAARRHRLLHRAGVDVARWRVAGVPPLLPGAPGRRRLVRGRVGRRAHGAGHRHHRLARRLERRRRRRPRPRRRGGADGGPGLPHAVAGGHHPCGSHRRAARRPRRRRRDVAPGWRARRTRTPRRRHPRHGRTGALFHPASAPFGGGLGSRPRRRIAHPGRPRRLRRAHHRADPHGPRGRRRQPPRDPPHHRGPPARRAHRRRLARRAGPHLRRDPGHRRRLPRPLQRRRRSPPAAGGRRGGAGPHRPGQHRQRRPPRPRRPVRGHADLPARLGVPRRRRRRHRFRPRRRSPARCGGHRGRAPPHGCPRRAAGHRIRAGFRLRGVGAGSA